MDRPPPAGQPLILAALDRWAIEASKSMPEEGRWVFVPIIGDFEGDNWFPVEAMAVVADRPPGKLVGIVHVGGDDAVEAWIGYYADDVHALLSRRDIP